MSLFFVLNYKTTYTSQILTVNHSLYKTYKSTTFNLNIKIVITVVTQYKMQTPFFGCSQLIQGRNKWDNNVRLR